jgi:predicted signal transduction protein with EAL and GGDEF domain
MINNLSLLNPVAVLSPASREPTNRTGLDASLNGQRRQTTEFWRFRIDLDGFSAVDDAYGQPMDGAEWSGIGVRRT